VIGWAAAPVTTAVYDVVAVDKTNGTMTLKKDSAYFFIDDDETVIYKVVSGSKVYIVFDGVTVGGTVKWNATNPAFEYTAPVS